MPYRDPKNTGSKIRFLTEEEIERAKQDQGGIPLDRTIKKYIVGGLKPTYFVPSKNRVCFGCGRPINDSERAFPRYTRPKGGDTEGDRKKVNQWFCLECHEQREEAIISKVTSKGYRRRFLMGSENP